MVDQQTGPAVLEATPAAGTGRTASAPQAIHHRDRDQAPTTTGN